MTTTSETNPFYNVMPEVTSGPILRPKVAPQATPAPIPSPSVAPATAGPTAISSNGKAGIPANHLNLEQITPPGGRGRSFKKILLIAGLIILVGGGIAAGAYFLFIKKAPEAPAPAQTTDNSTPANPDVTTPAEWLQRYFGAETCTELAICGDKADPDRDGLDNISEYQDGTDPNNNDSDSDGIADGDEVLVFNSDPLLSRTYRDGEYNDSDFVKGGYDVKTNQPYTDQRLLDIKSQIKQLGLHQPTLTTLGTLSFELYEFTDPNIPPLPANLDVSPQAKLDRDSSRQATIKKVGAALLKYKADKKSFPPTDDFVVMADLIKSYNTVATNYNDPIGQEPYLYGYQATSNNADFTLTYYSETQNQLIKYTAKNAQDDATKDDSAAQDNQRKLDLENIQQALLVYSSTKLDPNSDKEFVFPTVESMKSELTPRYIQKLPVDPTTKLDYVYQVGDSFDTFTIKAVLQNPPPGTTGYMCNQTECKNY